MVGFQDIVGDLDEPCAESQSNDHVLVDWDVDRSIYVSNIKRLGVESEPIADSIRSLLIADRAKSSAERQSWIFSALG